MDILKRIDHAQQFCKFYADGAYSVEKEKWNYHVTPEFIKDIRQYIESLQLKLMHLQKQQAEPCIGKDPRCPCQDGDACHYKDCVGTKARLVAQRTWVGLTEEDWDKVGDMPDTFDQGAAWAAARLKAKNDH